MNTTERFEKVNIHRLVPYARNARTHSKEQILQLRASLREFGFVNPVIVDKDLNIIAGHGRILAAKEEGMTEVPCVFAEHLTEAQKRAYILADNRLALNAGWDAEMLSVELADLQGADFDISLLGFDNGELNKLLGGMEDVKEDDFDVDAELKKPAFTKRGDIWLLGNHRVMCGDSTRMDEVKTLMAGRKARFIFTDPPWNVDYGATKNPRWKPRNKIMNDNMTTDAFGDFLLGAFRAMREVSEDGCMTYVVMSAQEWGNLMNAMYEAGYHWSSTIIWKKDRLVLSRKDYHTQYEPIWYGWVEGTRLFPLEDRKQSDVWDIERPKVSVEHPTMKPIALMARALENSSQRGDLVLDLFGGSGSTLIAAEQTRRICNMMELDPKYCDVIVKRTIEQLGSDEGVRLLRDGVEYKYSDVPGVGEE